MTAWFVKEARKLAAGEATSVQQEKDILAGNHDGMASMKALIKAVKAANEDPYLIEARTICADWFGSNSKYYEDYLLGKYDKNLEVRLVYDTLIKYDVDIKP